METQDLSGLLKDAEDDAAWIFDIYREDDDDARTTRSNEVRQRLRAMARRHRLLVNQLKVRFE